MCLEGTPDSRKTRIGRSRPSRRGHVRHGAAEEGRDPLRRLPMQGPQAQVADRLPLNDAAGRAAVRGPGESARGARG